MKGILFNYCKTASKGINPGFYTHKIYKSFDEGFEVRGVLLYISKGFDKVWDEGLFLKINKKRYFWKSFETFNSIFFLAENSD